MVRMGALGLGISLGHIRAFLGLAVVVRPITVVDVARSIHPHQARSAASRLRHRRSLRRGGSLRRRSRSSRRRRGGRSRNLRSSRSSSSRSRSRRSRGSSRRSRGSSRIPLLHPLVPTASALFAGSRRISSILALSGRSRRCLSHRNMRSQKSSRNRHQTNRCLHKYSQ
jgi:hypothetical protein